jgi:hypothetical protein
MKLKELKTLFKISIEQTLLEPLLKVGFKWKKSSMGFQRNKGDFSQSILFFLSPIKYYDDESIGHITIMIRLDAPKITEIATQLKGANNKFDAIDTFINVDAGIFVGTHTLEWRPTSIDNMNELIENNIKPLIINTIVPTLNNRSSVQNVLNDFENSENYLFANSKEVNALLAIAMYYMQNDIVNAKKVINEFLLSDDVYRERYKDALLRLNI